MRSLLLCAVGVLAGVAIATASPFIRANHRGVLNRRLDDSHFTAAALADGAQYYQQTLDHNNPLSGTFAQKYYVNDTWFDSENPRLFVMIGGEGPITPAYVNGHFYMSDLAQQVRALQVVLEHRFYGESVPNNDSSTANLQYLTSEQALADLASFTNYFMTQYPPAAGTPTPYVVVSFGGSYSGSLSAWARLKYPELFIGAYAASAPLQAQLDFPQYFEIVSASLGPAVSASLAQSTAIIEQMLGTDAGRATLMSDFNLCGPIVTDDDAMNFVSSLTTPFAETVQYNNDSVRLMQFDVPTIQNLMAQADGPMDALIAVWNAYNSFTQVSGCTDISYTNMIQSMMQTGAGRSWTWQTCNEFGYFQTAESAKQPFSHRITLASFVDQCAQIFGITGLTPNIANTNAYYGGDLIVTNRTSFTNGDVDPWHALGNYQSYPNQESWTAAILIHGTAHCADMYPAMDSDPVGLTNARVVSDSLLREWMATEQ